jgi:hypothetical protein
MAHHPLSARHHGCDYQSIHRADHSDEVCACWLYQDHQSWIGYHAHHDPCPILVVQPTLEDAQGYSKDEIAPMLRDTPALQGVFSDPKSKSSDNTIIKKLFPGGQLLMIGANSARVFRRASMRIVIFDETDGYPPSAGPEGDQIKLGIRRTEYYPNRNIIEGSTPTLAGASRIETSFHAAQQRLYITTCPVLTVESSSILSGRISPGKRIRLRLPVTPAGTAESVSATTTNAGWSSVVNGWMSRVSY